ncbi:MAG TPA: glycosyltransferase family 39 protein [Chloroflexia bacterium]
MDSMANMSERLRRTYSAYRRQVGAMGQRPQALPYLANAAAGDGPDARPLSYAFQATGQGTSPRRYVGRSVSQRARERAAPQVAPPAPMPARKAKRDATPGGEVAAAPIARPSVNRWSLRLIVAFSLVMGLGLTWRLLGVFTPPVDAATGVEATHAAFSNVLAGRVAGSLDPLRFFPPPAPWYGPAPALPTGGLPLYGWITAAGMGVLGGGEWLGRALSAGFSLIAGFVLFSLVRVAAGTRAALYALLLFSIAPFSIVMGQHFSPAALLLLAQAAAMWSLLNWRASITEQRRQGSGWAFAVAITLGVLAALLDPGSVFITVPAAYVVLAPRSGGGQLLLARRPSATVNTWRDAWAQSANKGKLAGYASALVGAAFLWWLFSSSMASGLTLTAGDGGGGASSAMVALLSGGTYVQMVGLVIEKVLTVAGLLLLLAGALQGARPPVQFVFHAWLAGGLLHVLADASRLGRHDDVLLPILLPLCALVGVGAAWAGSLPARVLLAVTEQRRENASEYAVSPHTSWLLDLPEERVETAPPARPQAQLALGKSIAMRAQRAGSRARRVWFIGVGHLAVLAGFAVIALAGSQTATARLQPTSQSLELAATGHEVAAITNPGDRLIVAGPAAPSLFFASARTGWVIPEDDFSIAEVQSLQREGAAYLLSIDQEWLGHHADYTGLLTNYTVKKLARNYILFDLSTKPSANDRQYFLESGHTLGGEFRRFWEAHGGVAKLGYPISEELDEASPLDGVTRTTQYFERAVLEYHPEFAGTPNSVMLASVGRWVLAGRELPRVAPFASTPTRVYFAETGHSLKEAFLRYWQREGGLAMFGYPISEELPEISPADGKVYTVQYFERARFEWHPTDAGTPKEVQLGLIGKQALEMRK